MGIFNKYDDRISKIERQLEYLEYYEKKRLTELSKLLQTLIDHLGLKCEIVETHIAIREKKK